MNAEKERPPLDPPLPKLTDLDRVGKKTLTLLERLGITDIERLVTHYPRDYEDRRAARPISDYDKEKSIFVRARVSGKEWFGFGRMRTLKVYIEDDSASAALVCFGRSMFLDKQIETGDTICVFGHFFYKYGEIQSSSFELDSGESAELLPVYPLTEGLTQKTLRRLVREALSKYVLASPPAALQQLLRDIIPEAVREREGYPSKKKALCQIHFPKDEAEAAKAREALIYEELWKLETALAKRRADRQNTKNPAFVIKSAGLLQKSLRARLSFKLTAGQEEAIADINADMESGVPMERLLQGDVGSGKTLVSFLAALSVIEAGRQAALLAPTELLARQHAENAAALLEPLGVSVVFLSGNVAAKNRRPLLAALAAGDAGLICGTHALFSEDTVYHNLRLVIIDEQHRFGIEQRRAILRKGEESGGLKPHLLMMSATPIPRTLALTAFGDWDVSVIKGMPHGRLPIETHLARQSNAAKVYEAVRRELQKGHQSYFVYPLIEKTEKKDGDSTFSTAPAPLYASILKDATSMFDELSRAVFPEYRLALLHSQVDEEEKRRIMDEFRAGRINILVATSVVEVGVDVPNAVCMVVEHAERFGLAALHQLRGRVGRGAAQSFCFLVYTDDYTEEMRDRLLVMHNTNDGFRIAEEDLKIRGPGQILGTGQSGFMKLGIADPIRDADILQKARSDAFGARDIKE